VTVWKFESRFGFRFLSTPRVLVIFQLFDFRVLNLLSGVYIFDRCMYVCMYVYLRIGIDDGKDVDRDLLTGIYGRIKMYIFYWCMYVCMYVCISTYRY